MARAAIACLACVGVGAETLSFGKVHLVDHSPATNNFIFRSNMPLLPAANGSLEFAYANLTAFMASRAQSEAGLTLPSRFFLQIVSFDNPLEITDIQHEVDWVNANPSLGNITFWPLLGQLEPPAWVSNATRYEYASNDTKLWSVDELPSRLHTLNAWLSTPTALPTVFVVHCEAGCDRTGEFSAGYYTTFQGYNITGAWDRDVAACGREPEFWSKNAIQWYCLTAEVQHNAQLGDCINW